VEETAEQRAKREKREAEVKAIAEAAVGIIDWLRASPERTALGLAVAGVVGAWLTTPTAPPKQLARRKGSR
jgi:hypothetical protein